MKVDSYDEELTKNMLSGITSDRKEIEARDRKIADEQATREFDLRKLELQARNNTITPSPTNENNLLHVMTKSERPGDISVYLNSSKRQIGRICLNKKEGHTY